MALLATAHADPTSIMCYWLPASIMKNGVAVTGGSDIDAQDQAFAPTVYPKPKSVVKTVHRDKRALSLGGMAAPAGAAHSSRSRVANCSGCTGLNITTRPLS